MLLEVRSVFKEYGGLSVLADISLALPERGLFALCGPNGAGKSTLLNVIGGSVPPTSGQVLLNGADITRRPPNERFYQGVSRTFQAVHLIKGRTVLDNVAVACLASHTSSIVDPDLPQLAFDQARAQAARALADLGMADLAGREVSSLTLETQRMVELARALAPNPRLLLLDEPASGLSEEQRQRLAGLLSTLADRTCVLLVEHDLALVAQVSASGSSCSRRLYGPCSSTAVPPDFLALIPGRQHAPRWELTADREREQTLRCPLPMQVPRRKEP